MSSNRLWKPAAAPVPAGSVIEQGRHGERADGDRRCEDLPPDRMGAGTIDDVTENRCAQTSPRRVYRDHHAEAGYRGT